MSSASASLLGMFSNPRTRPTLIGSTLKEFDAKYAKYDAKQRASATGLVQLLMEYGRRHSLDSIMADVMPIALAVAPSAMAGGGMGPLLAEIDQHAPTFRADLFPVVGADTWARLVARAPTVR